jgi:hypothetical protein
MYRKIVKKNYIIFNEFCCEYKKYYNIKSRLLHTYFKAVMIYILEILENLKQLTLDI